MQLRAWQKECVDKVLSHYKNDNKHFMCLATPGAGKTVMAAEVSSRLLNDKAIDFVFCFSPSVLVAEGFQSTFSRYLDCRFDGLIGSKGCSYTYQSLAFFSPGFWELFKRHRILVIFDEIHHCAGITKLDANAWGKQILENIQKQSTYTLALTGTPWRSDGLPIALSKYTDPEGIIRCDFTYGINEAVRDKVCRTPKIVLVDNKKIQVSCAQSGIRSFESIRELLDNKVATYQDVLSDDKAVEHILSLGCNKLSNTRKEKPNAGGLVVASSVKHAQQIARILQTKFNQSVLLVSYQEENPSNIIEAFKSGSQQWIVSIAMISEGTDIPRLQVCCHLSRIKTELYFRQILGRIMRVDKSMNNEAWLYTFKEPSLSVFAHRIAEDLPEAKVLIHEYNELMEKQIESHYLHSGRNPDPVVKSRALMMDFSFGSKEFLDSPLFANTSYSPYTIDILGEFKQKVISTFDSPF